MLGHSGLSWCWVSELGAIPQALWLCSASLQLLSAMVARLGNRDDPLPQDSFEGVDEDEWVGARGGG